MAAGSKSPILPVATRASCAAWLLALFAVTAVGGGGMSFAAAPACIEVGSAPTDLRAAPADASAITETITIPSEYRESVRVQSAFTLEGHCQVEVVGFEVSNIYLMNDRLVERSAANEISVVRAMPSSTRFADINSGDARPIWRMGNFIMASRVDGRRSEKGMIDYFVGVWRSSAVSTLGVFARNPNGTFSQPAVLLTSKLPIRSVSYFPSPDTPAGLLGVTQEGSSELRLSSISWYHPKLSR